MKIEHIGICVANPVSTGKWYEKNLGFKVLMTAGNNEDGVVFLKDDESTVIEIARVPEIPPLDFKQFNELTVHLAIECVNPEAEARRLVEAGAEYIGESIRNAYQGEKILVRDPWGGLTIQLINRKQRLTG